MDNENFLRTKIVYLVQENNKLREENLNLKILSGDIRLDVSDEDENEGVEK